MGSVGNPNPWAPYNNYKDCSQGICSIYCPQFCYLIFPPPPSDDDSGTPFSPLIIAIIGVLASALLLVSYYTIVARYCRRRNDHNSTSLETDQNRDDTAHDQWQIASNGLDEALIKTIAVCKYQKSDGLIEGSECAVCLSEFQENESLRLLPKCSHAFHLPCIDTWLKSHSNCPLCRANVVVLTHPSIPLEQSSQTPTAFNTNPFEFHRPNDLVLVVDLAQESCEQVVVSLVNDNGNAGDLETTGRDQESVEQFRRSISLGTFSCQRQLLVSDILKIEEIDEDLGVESVQSWKNIGSSKGVNGEESKSSPVPVGVNRSISAGTFMFTVHDKGKNSSSPH